ncbi:MAG: type IV secretion system DNA-binding domain-containing protein [Lachnospiraceae bacterium]|nr:type IV secretion system DNA-binding domain-containing protein [Lachnospiraceae bacterium]
MQGINSYERFAGNVLGDQVTIRSDKPIFALVGDQGLIPVDESLLSKHILLLGGIGTGKSNVMYHLVRNIRSQMTTDDVMVIFDPKGDYIKKFRRPGDIVISNDSRNNVHWNVFREILIDDRVEENALEVAGFLFKDKIKNSSNPFFPNAAKDLFAALMLYIIRCKIEACENNRALRRNADSKSSADYTRFFSQFDDLKGICSYIGDDAKGQAQGVISEFQQTIREIFIGEFRQKGDFSIRQAVRDRGAKAIFIEYDLSIGKTLAPIYALLMELAIKETLSRSEDDKGNVYFVMDEFRLMSSLDHMDNGINFGRSLGAKFILGVQNVEQIYDVYGEYAARSILSGCTTLISFFVTDGVSRGYIKDRAGQNLRKITFMSAVQTRGISEQIVNGNAIEDWDIATLGTGDAIVQSSSNAPFKFHFKLYQ